MDCLGAVHSMARRGCKTGRQGEAAAHVQISNDEDLSQNSDWCREEGPDIKFMRRLKDKVGINGILDISGLDDAFNRNREYRRTVFSGRN